MAADVAFPNRANVSERYEPHGNGTTEGTTCSHVAAAVRIWLFLCQGTVSVRARVGTDTNSVSVRAVTQSGPNGIWVTAYIQVTLS
jgi:hypothetical protein